MIYFHQLKDVPFNIDYSRKFYITYEIFDNVYKFDLDLNKILKKGNMQVLEIKHLKVMYFFS